MKTKEQQIYDVLERLHDSAQRPYEKRNYFLADAYRDILDIVFEDFKKSFPHTFATRLH